MRLPSPDRRGSQHSSRLTSHTKQLNSNEYIMLANKTDQQSIDSANFATEPFRTNFTRSRAMQIQAHAMIPGGCHSYGKGDDQFPVDAPGFIARGEGCHVWDVDGNEFIEYGMGCRAVTLGHGYKPVVEAAQREMIGGSNFTRPAAIELECAEAMRRCLPGAEMVKFSKDGSAATSGAVKLARAVTGRDHIALCGDHPFFATADWFIGTTAIDAGIPQVVKDLSHTFRYNDIDSLQQVFQQYPGKISGVILEPAKYEDPKDNFLHKVKDLCHQNGALFILDEIITGFRWKKGSGQACYDITADLSTFGKAMANGFSVSALAGKKDIMERGGLHHEDERVFLMSTTHGAETHSLAAAIETMRIYESEPVVEKLDQQGKRLRDGINEAISRHGIGEAFKVIGKPCCLVYAARDAQNQPSQAFRTLFLQETIKRGLIMPSLIVSYSHTDADIDATTEGVDAALYVYRKALCEGVERYLHGRPSKIVYRKRN